MYSVEVVGQEWWGRLRGRQGSGGQEHYTSRLRLKGSSEPEVCGSHRG